jgi:uncharacterized protein (TIGR02246 family)
MTADEKAIRNAIALWHAATAQGDVGTVLSLMVEDAIFLTPGNPPMRGRSTFENGLRTVLKSHRIESTGDVKEVEVSGDLAYTWTELKVKIVPLSGGSPMTRSGNTLSIFRKSSGGAWQLVRDANLLAAPAP